MMIRFWRISIKRFPSCSKFSNSLTYRCKTKWCALISNTDYFKPVILNFTTFIYNSNCKITYNFCICENNIFSVGDVTPEENFFNIAFFKKNISKYARLIVEPYICDHLNKIWFILIFNQKKKKKSFRKLSGKQ